jgi:hypothetical protein
MKAMKIYSILLISITLFLSCLYSSAQNEKELKARKIKVITIDNQTITPEKVILSDSSLTYLVSDSGVVMPYKDVMYIYIKEGSNFPQVLMYCTLFGLGYGIIYGIYAVTGTFIENVLIGLAGGLIAAVIVAPFVRKPDKLIFYKGKWTDSKYAP